MTETTTMMITITRTLLISMNIYDNTDTMIMMTIKENTDKHLNQSACDFPQKTQAAPRSCRVTKTRDRKRETANSTPDDAFLRFQGKDAERRDPTNLFEEERHGDSLWFVNHDCPDLVRSDAGRRPCAPQSIDDDVPRLIRRHGAEEAQEYGVDQEVPATMLR